MNKTIAVMGNPNSGKTTLFNYLTNGHEKVGNWSGVTVDKKEGALKSNKSVTVVDLPGIYGLSAKSTDEKLVLDYLRERRADCFINVVDSRNLARSLRLTNLLSSYGVPTVIALNFADKIKDDAQIKNLDEIKKAFGVPVINISANKGVNVELLIKTALYAKEKPKFDKDAYLKIVNAEGQSFLENDLSNKLDRVITGKFTGIPVFFCVMFIVYFLTLKLGGYFSGVISEFFEGSIVGAKSVFYKIGVPKWLGSLFTDGILKGIGSVISFLPQILILFLLLGVLEQTGYMARVTFIFDRVMRSVGLCGKSVIPMVLSSGCTATGVMGARTIEDKEERKLTVYLSAFIPCGAKCAVFSWFAYNFFDGNVLVAVSMYFLGIITAIISGKILSLKRKRQKEQPFLLEIPDYSLPNPKNLFFTVYEKSKEFLIKAGSVIFVLSVLVWVLKSFNFKGYTEDVNQSFIFYLGNYLRCLFYPIGVTDWRVSVSLISGIFAKEGVVETLELLGGNFSSFFNNGFSVYAFMSFILLSPPCVATLAVCRKELGSRKDFIKMILFQIAVAYLTSVFINLLGVILLVEFRLIFASILIIITIIGFVLGIKNAFSSCKNCKCVGVEKCHKKK